MSSSGWPQGTTAFIREEDGEKIGYLIPESDLWVPANLLGIPLGDPADRASAESQLMSSAMASIIEPYWCRIPRPLTSDRTDARAVDPSEWFDRVLVVEIGEKVATLKPHHLYESEQSALITVTLPAADVLFMKQPAD